MKFKTYKRTLFTVTCRQQKYDKSSFTTLEMRNCYWGHRNRPLFHPPWCTLFAPKICISVVSLSIRPSYGGGGRGRRERFVSFASLPFSLPSFPFSPETPDTQAKALFSIFSWDGCNTQEKWKTKVMQNFGWQIKCIMGDAQVAYTLANSWPARPQ